MRIRWREFELPNRVELDKDTATPTFGRFIVEPFQKGFGTTIGNGLRRVLLSSIEGAAVSGVRIDGVLHEFSTIEGIYEDMPIVILNLKRLRLRIEGDEPVEMKLDLERKGEVTAADIEVPANVEILNPELKICTLTDNIRFSATIYAKKGRGYVPAEENLDENSEIGLIPVDSLYSPVFRCRYSVGATRLGEETDYDRLVLEIWTDGSVSPEMALVEAGKIYRKHLNPFIQFFDFQEEEVVEPITLDLPQEKAEPVSELDQLLDQPLDRLELSVRAKNCLDSENILTIRELVSLSESDLLRVRNFGKTSLKEVQAKLQELGLSFGMSVPPRI